MELNLLIVSQEGVTWDTGARLPMPRTIRSPDAFCGRPLHLDSGRAGQGRPRRLDGHRRPGGAHLGSATRHHGLSGDVSPPAVLANAVATADHISGGRVESGRGRGGWSASTRHSAFRSPPRGCASRCSPSSSRSCTAVDRGTGHVQRQPLYARKRAWQAEATAVSSSPTHRRWPAHAGDDPAARSLRRQYNVSWDSDHSTNPDAPPAGDSGLRHARP